MNFTNCFGWAGDMKVGIVSAVLTAFLGVFVISSGRALAGEVLEGPVKAHVLSVIDGDTLDVMARVWLGQEVHVRVRIAGVDAPELRGRCAGEKALAEAARAFVIDQTSGRRIELTAIRYGKYAGRIVAEVMLEDGSSLGDRLITSGHARPYDGSARAPWCPETAQN